MDGYLAIKSLYIDKAPCDWMLNFRNAFLRFVEFFLVLRYTPCRLLQAFEAGHHKSKSKFFKSFAHARLIFSLI